MIITAVLLVTLIALSGCASSAEATSGDERSTLAGTASVLLSSLPSLPQVPAFPSSLDWGYDEETGLYTLSAEECDRILYYRDLELPLYILSLQQYENILDAIVNRIEELNL